MNNPHIRVVKKLNGHQIDVIRRAIKFLIERDGKSRLVILAKYLMALNENGFTDGSWCGYGKLRLMIEAYPEFFEIYDTESKDLAVRIVGNHGIANQETKPVIDMNFDHFVYNNISQELAQKACEKYHLREGLEDYCVFCNYLRYTYYKAIAENKVLELGNLRLFHTGWFYHDTDDIYMLWGYDQDGMKQNAFLYRSSKETRFFIHSFGNNIPEMVHYDNMQFDTSLHIEPEFGHIIDEHIDRIPEEIIDILRLNPDLHNCGEVSDNEKIVKYGWNFLRRLLTGCIMDTRSRLANRRNEAVLFWNRRTNKMCWLLPLRLGLTEKVNLTLVVEPSRLNDKPVYRAHTILPLKEAFKCARLLGPVRAEWLRDSWKV